MSMINKMVLLAAASLSVPVLNAQEAKPLPRHPGDTIKFEVVFNGPNAEKIKYAAGALNIEGPIPKDQSGFNSGFGVRQQVPPSAPKTFILEMIVPDNIATGDYLFNVSARADEGSAGYRDGQDFHLAPIHIENPRTFTPPAITVKQLP